MSVIIEPRVEPRAAVKTAPTRIRLEYLDGLRGLSALYVVLFHAWEEVCYRPTSVSPGLYSATHWLAYGRFAVAVFIVLSGYCLMLPVARAADGSLRGGTLQYLKRRARRILPPYYAALILSLIAIALIPGMSHKSGANWDWALPAFTPSVIGSHLLLVHNLSQGWIGKIDPPMWSVATEWQIYFVFPLLLLPVWRRFGAGAAVAAGFALGLTLHFLPGHPLDQAAPWFIGLFALGMAAAAIGFSRRPRLHRWRTDVPWAWISGVLFAALALMIGVQARMLHNTVWIDALIGVATSSLLIHCTRYQCGQSGSGPAPLALRVLDSRPLLILGGFSYSLYLMHSPILAALTAGMNGLRIAPVAELGLSLAVGVPVSVALCYVFYLAFERPFTSKS